jgi:hypothetical protein
MNLPIEELLEELLKIKGSLPKNIQELLDKLTGPIITW